MFKISLAQVIDGEFFFCNSKEINNVINPKFSCKHPSLLNAKLQNHLVDQEIKIPTNIYVLSRNKYYANGI